MTNFAVVVDGERHPLDVPPGQNLMSAITEAGLDGVIAECGGNAQCATCHVYVLEGLAQFDAPTDDEEVMLDYAASPRRDNSRLSCQLAARAGMVNVVVETPPRQV